MSDMWSLNSYYYAFYTEDEKVIQNISQEPKCEIMAEYYRLGKRFAVQYKVPRPRKQHIEELIASNG